MSHDMLSKLNKLRLISLVVQTYLEAELWRLDASLLNSGQWVQQTTISSLLHLDIIVNKKVTIGPH